MLLPTTPAAALTALTARPVLAADLVLGIVPRAARMPSDMAELLARESGAGLCAGVRSAELMARKEHIAGLIEAALCQAA